MPFRLPAGFDVAMNGVAKPFQMGAQRWFVSSLKFSECEQIGANIFDVVADRSDPRTAAVADVPVENSHCFTTPGIIFALCGAHCT